MSADTGCSRVEHGLRRRCQPRARTGARRSPRRRVIGHSVPVSDGEDWARRTEEIAAARARRSEVIAGREPLVAMIEALLFEQDPIGINFESNTDEYRAEAESIVIRLSSAHDEADTATIVHEEFIAWFGSDIAGPATRYAEIARQVWALWQRRDG